MRGSRNVAMKLQVFPGVAEFSGINISGCFPSAYTASCQDNPCAILVRRSSKSVQDSLLPIIGSCINSRFSCFIVT
jgi:hypothetical protein